MPHRANDKDKARALMAEAGYSESNPLELTLLTYTPVPDWVAAAEILKENLDQCYFNITIRETAEFTPYATGDFDLGLMGTNLSNNFYYYAMMFDINSNDLALYQEADAEDIVNMITGAHDQEAATKAMQAFDATMAYCPVAYTTSLWAFDENLVMEKYVNGYRLEYARWAD